MDILGKRRTYNKAAKFYKKAVSKARFDHIRWIGNKLASYPAGSSQFAKSVESSFYRPSLTPGIKFNGSLAHTVKDKANLFSFIFT